MRSPADHSQASTRRFAPRRWRGWLPRPWAGWWSAGVENHGAPLGRDFRQGRGGQMASSSRKCAKASGCGNGSRSGFRSIEQVDAPVSSMRKSSSALVELAGAGTAIPPARQMPHCTATQGNRGPPETPRALPPGRHGRRAAPSLSASTCPADERRGDLRIDEWRGRKL